MSSVERAFFFDLASPLAYLAAERVLHELPLAAEWRPVQASALGADGQGEDPALRAHVEAEALRLGLQPVRWPQPFPFDSSLAMRVATYARAIGRTVPFAQAAFRQAFAGGRSLAEADNVLIAAAACEMHPAAVLKGAELRSTAEQLALETQAAAAAGVGTVPALLVDGFMYEGPQAVEQAAARMRAITPSQAVA